MSVPFYSKTKIALFWFVHSRRTPPCTGRLAACGSTIGSSSKTWREDRRTLKAGHTTSYQWLIETPIPGERARRKTTGCWCTVLVGGCGSALPERPTSRSRSRYAEVSKQFELLVSRSSDKCFFVVSPRAGLIIPLILCAGSEILTRTWAGNIFTRQVALCTAGSQKVKKNKSHTSMQAFPSLAPRKADIIVRLR